MTIRMNEDFHYDFDDEMDVTPVEMMTMDELMDALEFGNLPNAEWSIVYKEFCRRRNEEHDKYFKENIDHFNKLTAELKAKAYAGTLTMQDLDYYSDYHKDMYGHRPRYDWLRLAH